MLVYIRLKVWSNNYEIQYERPQIALAFLMNVKCSIEVIFYFNY